MSPNAIPRSFITVCRRDKSYRQLTSRRKRSNEERLIEECVMRIAEREIGTLRTEIADMNGKLRTEREKRQSEKTRGKLQVAKQANVFLVTLAQFPTTFGKLITTPLNDLVLNATIPDRAGIADENTKTVIVENKMPQMAESPSKKIIDTKPQMASGTFQKAYDCLPKWLQIAVDFIASQIAKLTPLTSAVLLILILIGAWKYAEWSKSSLAEMKRLTDERNVTLSEMVDRLKNVDKENRDLLQKLEQEKGKRNATEVENGRLTGKIEELNLAATDKDKFIDQMQKDYAQQITQLRANANEEIGKLNKELSDQNEKLLRENQILRDANEKQGTELERLRPKEKDLADAVAKLATTTEQLNAALDNADKYKTSLDAETTNVKFLRALVRGMKLELDRGVLAVLDTGNFYKKRYRETYNSLLDSHFDYFSKECGLTRYK